jgi:hypothetical protein
MLSLRSQHCTAYHGNRLLADSAEQVARFNQCLLKAFERIVSMSYRHKLPKRIEDE